MAKEGDTTKNENGMSPEILRTHLNLVAYENMLENMYFGKFQGIMGDEIYIKELPCVVGRKISTSNANFGLKINQKHIFNVNERSLQNMALYQN